MSLWFHKIFLTSKTPRHQVGTILSDRRYAHCDLAPLACTISDDYATHQVELKFSPLLDDVISHISIPSDGVGDSSGRGIISI